MKFFLTITYLLLPVVIVLCLIFGTSFLLEFWKKFSRRGKRSPLKNYKLWRNPGESLRTQIDDATIDLMADLAVISISVVVFSPFYVSQAISWQKGEGTQVNFWIAIFCNFALIAFCFRRIIKTWTARHNLQLGLDGEMYVGQQLNHLMLFGCRVYHDFQTDRLGNIDHIVVSPSGVFAIETKGKYKPDRHRGKKDAEVIFDGKLLHFSDVVQTDQPIKQAQRNAENLTKWLSSAVGKTIPVKPVVALPGWFITCKAPPGNVKFINGKIVEDTGQLVEKKVKNSVFFRNNNVQHNFSADLFGRVVHQLDQKCRDVEPGAYNMN